MNEMWELNAMDRRYSVPPSTISEPRLFAQSQRGSALLTACEDLHAWSIYRQNLNSDFTDSALGSQEKAPLPFGNFQLRESTVHSIMNNPRYGPKSDLGNNMYTYLKFGLPRVFPPPIRPREGSSGYDSSDDGGVGRSGRGAGIGHHDSPLGRRERYARSRSNPDLLAARDWGLPIGRDTRAKSSSEANLLSPDSHYKDRRRARASSKIGGSQMSLVSRRSRMQGGIFTQPPEGGGMYREPPMLNDKMFPRDSPWAEEAGIDFKVPHLQIRGLVYEIGSANGKTHFLDGISVEARGGELLAIMATSESEGTCLLDILGACHSRWKGRMRGDIILNGSVTTLKKVASRSAYVKQDVNFCPDMSVRQTLLLHSFLRECGDPTRVRNVKARINALIEDLGLEQVKHTRVQDITLSEKRRLNVACHLLLETDIVLLDQPTRGMDIFDTFFLVEYLRQWACRGRIIVLTIQPPTYEIFTMVSRVALISTGRLMYFGKRREMLPYFAFIEYPCPAYKNPADYYIDLVTLDDLTQEAMLESSQRVQMLADTFRRRQEALSDPGLPMPLPPKVRTANFCMQFLALWIRAMIYEFPYNMVFWLLMSVLGALMSLVVGAVFWDVRSATGQQQENINNRVHFHYVMAVVAIWPMLLLSISEVWRDKPAVLRDVLDGLYSRTTYIITKFFYSFLAAGGGFLAYILPAYTMAGFHVSESQTRFYLYAGYMLLYMFAIRAIAMACAAVFDSRHTSAAVTGLIMTVASLGAGIMLHIKELSSWTWPTVWWSPCRWLLKEVITQELEESSDFLCDRNPVMKDLQSIIQRKVSCGIVTGTQALRYLSLEESKVKDPYYPLLFILGAFIIGQLITVTAFVFNKHPIKVKKCKGE